MKVRLATSTVFLALLAGVHCGAATEKVRAADDQANDSGARPPNVLWICTDQQRWDTIGELGNPHLRTPHLDRLVREGAAFTHAHCPAPICTASRAAMLTGMYPSAVHGCKNGAAYWAEAAPLATKLLKDAGYTCGLSGKLHLSTAMTNNPERRPKDDGYSVFHYSHSPSQGGDQNAYLRWLTAQGHTFKQVKRLPWKKQFPLHQTTWCCDRAIDLIRANKDRPWLFSVNMFDPHPPLDPPPDFAQRFDIQALPGPLWRESDLQQKTVFDEIMFQGKPQRIDPRDGRTIQAKYWAMVEMIDENVGRLMKVLSDTGQQRNTVVVFTSDHGNMTGDHGMRGKGCRFYEGIVRVPLIIWSPDRFLSNLRTDALVDLTDIAPTLMEIATGKCPVGMQGKSLLPILTGKADPGTHRDAVRCEFYSCVGPCPSRPQWPDSYGTMLRTHRYKISVYHGIERGELFDMEKDPDEFENLWDDAAFGEIRDKMARACFEATVAANLPNMPIMTNAEEARRKAKATSRVRFTNRKKNGVWTSHYEDGKYRLIVRHGADQGGALYDLGSPKPERNRWDDPDCRELRNKLVKQCFDAFVFSIDPGPERIGRY